MYNFFLFLMLRFSHACRLLQLTQWGHRVFTKLTESLLLSREKKISEMPLCRKFFYFKSNITFLIQDKFWLLMNTNISRLADTESWILKAKKFYMFRNFTLIFTFFLIKNVKYTWFTILCSFSVYSNVMIQFELCFYICMLFS